MKRILGLALLAAIISAGASTAQAGTFGLFTCGSCCMGGCSPCPKPYNAFSAFPCCATANAAGCSYFPPAGVNYSNYVAQFGPGPGCCGGQQWYGFNKHWGHAHGFPYDLPLPYPCGALAAFTGTPGMGGCGDPYSGCGTPRLHPKVCCFPDSNCLPKPGLLGHLKTHGCNFGGGDVVVDGAIDGGVVSSDLAPVETMPVTTAPTPAPVYQPVSYQSSYYPTYYPNYYGSYYPNWGYYPTYGY